MATTENLGSAARHLRTITIATFLPALPLCIAHGALSHNAVPAVGLVPLASSAGLGTLLLRQKRHRSEAEANQPEQEPSAEPTRPISIFLADAVHAAALIVVLVFTWLPVSGQSDAALSMLASYATIPLLINLMIHLYLAVSALYTGLAVHALIQWLAWQVVPPDCPNCSHRLRPSLPQIPWLLSRPQISMPRWKMKMPATPLIRAPEWKMPAWLKASGTGHTRLFVSEEQRYRDDPEFEGSPARSV